jgi:hypothetical protein
MDSLSSGTMASLLSEAGAGCGVQRRPFRAYRDQRSGRIEITVRCHEIGVPMMASLDRLRLGILIASTSESRFSSPRNQYFLTPESARQQCFNLIQPFTSFLTSLPLRSVI